jgi:predicted RNA-binding protein YlxR (DUF448 family)
MENKLHVAWRTCIGTGEKKDKKEMLRLVKIASGEVVVDVKGKERGRGANLCLSLEAFDAAVKKRAIDRALKLETKLTPEQVQDLRDKFAKAIEEKQFRSGNKKVTLKISKAEFDKINSAKTE